jgi:hypothetical protein
MSKKIQQTSILSGFFIVISLIASSGLQAAEKTNTTQKAALNRYPQDFTNNYMKSCNAVAGKELPSKEAQELCTCTLKNFQSRYSYDQYKKLSQETREEVGYSCFDSILYEE